MQQTVNVRQDDDAQTLVLLVTVSQYRAIVPGYDRPIRSLGKAHNVTRESLADDI